MSTGKGLVPDVKGSSAIERIALYYFSGGDETVLYPKDKEIMARLTFVDDSLRALFTGPETVNRLLARYPHISRATALKDLTDARKVFGATAVHDRNYNKDFIDGVIKTAIRKALQLGDIRSVGALTKNLIVLHGLDREPVDEALKKLQAHTIHFVFDPKLLGVDAGKGDLENRINQFLGKKDEDEFTEYEHV